MVCLYLAHVSVLSVGIKKILCDNACARNEMTGDEVKNMCFADTTHDEMWRGLVCARQD